MSELVIHFSHPILFNKRFGALMFGEFQFAAEPDACRSGPPCGRSLDDQRAFKLGDADQDRTQLG